MRILGMQKTLLVVSAMAIVLLSCTKVTNGGTAPASGSTDISPNASVPDPEGTIELKMRNWDNGRTYLDDFLYITSANNFKGGKIAALGQVRGLGNVARIPSSGWAEEVAVTPGNGYVVYRNEKFYRIFVEDFTLAAETEGIIGAAIKYQTPFYGLDEAPILENAQLTIPAEGTESKTIKLKNTSIIPLDIKLTSYDGQDYPEGISVSDVPYDIPYPFPRVTMDMFNNTLNLSCASNTTTSSVKTIYTLTTKYNKSVKLEITQEAAKAFGNFSPSSDYAKNGYPCTGVTADEAYRINSNIPINGFTVSSDKDWCKPALDGYYVYLTTDNNYGEARNATITLYSKEGEEMGKAFVKQSAASLRLSSSSSSVSASSGSFYVYVYYEPFSYSDIKVEYDNTIISSVEDRQYGESKEFRFHYNANTSDKQRNTVIKFVAGSEGISARFTLTQEAAYLTLNKTTPVLFDKNQGNRTYSISSNADWTAQSSASWCTTSRNGNNLTIRVESTTVDRKATITFPGFSAKLEVDQSKYAVGDNYSEGNVKGTVLYMNDNIRLIYKEVGEAQWSTENVQIGANSQYDGMANMNVVKAISGWKNLYPAFALCDALNTGGVTGWYLPAMVEGEVNLPIINTSSYWSSFEWSAAQARTMSKDYFNKSVIKNVAAVRKF